MKNKLPLLLCTLLTLSIFFCKNLNSKKYLELHSNQITQLDTFDGQDQDIIDSTYEDIDNIFIRKLFEYVELFHKGKYLHPNDEYYYELVKAYEIFSEVLKNLIQFYVVDLSPMELIQLALDGFTSQLDPYTKFYINEEEFNNALNQNDYLGLGIVVNVVDSTLMVVDYVDTLAKEISGIKLGDRILFVNEHQIPPNQDTLRKLLANNLSEHIALKVQREGIESLLTIKTFLRKISIPEVPFAKIFDFDEGSVLYIKILSFTYEMPEKVMELLTNYTNTKKNKLGIIIDLRDNPGGVLKSAIQLCEMLLPSGNTIITKEGRESDIDLPYIAYLVPIDSSTPLAILVNRFSASASEVVAGAIQDNDRGVIIGEQTFGKGLIQSVFNLPHKSYLKMTTSIYRTPSGRIIHHNKLNNSIGEKIEEKYSAENPFYTRNGRIVEQSNGIRPDIIITENKQSAFVNFLNSKMLFTLFVSYLENTQSLKNYLIEDSLKLLLAFTSYLKQKNITYKPPIIDELDSLYSKIANEEPNLKALEELKKIKKFYQRTLDNYVFENRAEIVKEITTEIKRRTLNFEEYNTFLLLKDNFFIEALKILRDKKSYYKILH